MYKNRFVKLMMTFSDYDMKQFERFLHSPYHNRSQQCIDVFEALKYYLSGTRAKPFTKVELSERAFKDTKKINTLEVVLSKLTRLAEDFIGLERLNRQPYMKQHLLLEELLERQNLEHFNHTTKQTIDRHDAIQRRGEQFYFEKYLLLDDSYKYMILTDRKSAWQSLNQAARALDEFYLIQRLQFLHEAENYKNLFSRAYHTKIDPTTSLLAIKDIEDNPMIALQHNMLLTVRDGDEKHFKRLLHLLDRYYLNIPVDELLNLYAVMGNFCVAKIVNGEISYNQILFTLYKKQAEQGILFLGKYISEQVMKNIISLGAQLNEFEWTEAFLESHSNYVKPDIKESVYHYNKAMLAFYQKDFRSAMEHLNQTEKMEFSFELGRKTVLLRTYYELKESLAFDALYKSFREYVHSQKEMPTRLKKAYFNFTSVLRKIERLRLEGGHNKILPLMEKINNYEFLTSKQWLIEKLEELPAYKRALAEAETMDD